ncbi:hypothetical protein DyAD56_09660 [Dyella sp. AD56]|nr:hypothetical protein DyAD56_09660 [Dyella sp. AD56]
MRPAAMRCAAKLREPSAFAFDPRAPCAAVRGGREGPQGDRQDADPFSPGQEPRRKARPPLTNWPASPASAKWGCPFFGLLFFGQAKKSDSASGKRSKARRRRARSPPRDNLAQSHWIPACAGMTAKMKRCDEHQPSPQPSPPRGEGVEPASSARFSVAQPECTMTTVKARTNATTNNDGAPQGAAIAYIKGNPLRRA